MTTFSSLLAAHLAADPSRPLVTFYDHDSGERVELSVATYANWVAKTGSLLVEEHDLERGQTLLVDLPVHWLGPIFLGAAWTVGLRVALPTDDVRPDAVVCGPAGLATWGDRAAELPVIASALRPLGVRFADPVPAGVHDFGADVWSQPDAFVPWEPAEPADEAMVGLSQAALLDRASALGRLEEAGRLLTTANPVDADGVTSFVEPLVRNGSLVLVARPDAARWDQLAASERATVAVR